MDLIELRPRDSGVPLVDAFGGAAVAHPVFCARYDTVLPQVALQAFDEYPRVGSHDLGIFRVALVGSPPAIVASHGQRRREGPFHSGGEDFPGGDPGDALEQVRIIRGP